jgi:hypothetical protein
MLIHPQIKIPLAHLSRQNFTTLISSFLMCLAAVSFQACDADSEEVAGEEVAGEEVAGTETAGEETAGEETAGEETAGEETAGEEAAGEEIMEPLAPEIPIIRRVRAFINRQDGGLGLQINGRDEDNNVTNFTIEYFFENGESLFAGENSGPIELEFSKLQQGRGDFEGFWTIPFLVDANVDLLTLAEAKVTVLDETGNVSPETTVSLLDTPTVDDGEQCDLNRGLSRCGETSLCETASGGRTTCGPAVAECPEYYNVIDLNAEGGTFEGDTSGQPTYGVGTCGGGSASQVFSFTADAGGQYSFQAEPTGIAPGAMGSPDTLMWIRSHCRFSDWVAELGCNDDVNTQAGDLSSIINLDLEAGQTVYIFIDGYSRNGEVGWTGPFILNVSQI